MVITIANWEEYNPRKDLKSMHWFRLESDMIFNHKLFKLSVSGKWLFIFILALCAKKMSACIDYDADYFSHYSAIPKKDITKLIKELQALELIRTDTNELDTNTNEKATNITEQNEQNTTNTTSEEAKIDLNGIWYDKDKGDWGNIPDKDYDYWEKMFPSLVLDTELHTMAVWIHDNPTKAPKSDFKRFISGWLGRSKKKQELVDAQAQGRQR